MSIFIGHSLTKDSGGYLVTLYLDSFYYEFSKELGPDNNAGGEPGYIEAAEDKSVSEPGDGRPGYGRPGDGRPGGGRPGDGRPGGGRPGNGTPRKGPRNTEPGCDEPGKKGDELREKAIEYINENLKDIKINTVKIVAGSLIAGTLSFTEPGPGVRAAAPQIQISQVYEQQNKIIINGKQYFFPQTPYVVKGDAFVPARGVAGALDASVLWDEDNNMLGINKDNVKIIFTLGSDFARINGRRINMNPSFLLSGEIMVALSFIKDAFGAKVKWNEATKTAEIELQ